MAPLGKRYAALLEVCLVTLILTFVAWLHQTYLSGIFLGFTFKTFMMLVALLAIILPKRSFRIYGFLPRSPRFTLKWSSAFIAAFILPTVVSIAMSAALGMAKPAGLSPLGIILNVIYFMIFVGLVEEAYFRGYVQSRLNEVFERRWRRLVFKAWKVDYGIGLLLTSVIFALIHIANYWNPITSRWEPVWWMPLHILGCFAFGCVAGAIREASDIYILASLHGGIMTAYTFLSIYTSELILNVSLAISWFIFFYLLAIFFHESENLKAGAMSMDLEKG
ncbi:MAG: CPBP family intramembrane glutamic endopeptidase [Candidatus Bathyarchaeia archaeon]|nr:CPBP family intramembrane metalloprotease [Candidatus Bathyarchaeota archaeon]